ISTITSAAQQERLGNGPAARCRLVKRRNPGVPTCRHAGGPWSRNCGAGNQSGPALPAWVRRRRRKGRHTKDLERARDRFLSFVNVTDGSSPDLLFRPCFDGVL